MKSLKRLGLALAGLIALACGPEHERAGGPGVQKTSAATVSVPPPWFQWQKLLSADYQPHDHFGYALSVSGETLLVGARYENERVSGAGAAYIFVRSGGIWSQQREILAPDSQVLDTLGWAVSLSGDTALIGAPQDTGPGSAYVFVRSGVTWTQQQKLLAPDGVNRDRFGRSVAVDGATAVVGAPLDDDPSGSAWVFARSGTSWIQQRKLVPSQASTQFGSSVSLEGDTVLVGAGSSPAYVFVRSGTVWTEQQKLVGSDAAGANCFGQAVSLSGNTAIIGDICDTEHGNSSGAAYVFTRSGTTWSEQQKLTPSDAGVSDLFGRAVAVSGRRAVIGAGDPGSLDTGSAYVFTRSGTTWTQQQALFGNDSEPRDMLGAAVAIDGTTAFVGAPQDNVPNAATGSAVGSTYVFTTNADPVGTPCSAGGDCASGQCVQNVCCNAECTGPCESCLGAHTGGADGTCSSVTAGTDPRARCSDEGASSCGTTGLCDDDGACSVYSSGTPCGDPVCVGSVLKDRICDGSGSCGNEAGGSDCAPFTCGGGACNDPCGGDDQCVPGHYCSQGSCIPKGGTGDACAEDGDCSDGHCVDDVCCDSACGDSCMACSTLAKGSGDDGICEAVSPGADPHDDCSEQTSESCGRTGQCDGSGACQLHAAGVSCGASSCNASVARGQVCDGDGACVTSTTGIDCAPHACTGGACRNPCSSGADCLGDYVCVGGVCREPGATGTPCSNGGDCALGFCVDGVCCDNTCAGRCFACSASKKGQGMDGECGPVRVARDPDDECATEAPSTCGQNGQCNGAGACARWPEGTECGPATCEAEIEVGASTCSEQGACVVGESTPCVPGYRCDDDACGTGCLDDSVCTRGYACDLVLDACVPDDGTAGAGGAGGTGEGEAGAGTTSGGTSGQGGAGGEAGDDGAAPKPSSAEDGGCGCRAAPGGSSRSAHLLALCAGLAIVLRRLRARSRPQSQVSLQQRKPIDSE